MTNEINNKLRNECQNTLATLEKLNLPETAELKDKLAWCIGSYDFDKNPAGLTECGGIALKTLVKIKAKNPRKVAKKVIDGLDSAIQNYNASQN